MTNITDTTEVEETKKPFYKKEIFIGACVVVALLIIAGLIALFVYNSSPKIQYQPAVACNYFTTEEAVEMIGDGAIATNNDQPVLNGDLATSKCGYADGNADTNALKVIAVIVRSGVNDKGVAQNKEEFTNGIPTIGVDAVQDIGDKAYFNNVNGQLNVLKGNNWFIISDGIGATPEQNTKDDAIAVAKLVLK